MSISSLKSQDVHRITSGQVIIDLATAVKELIENSLDANSTSIEVNFHNYGLASIEIIDNGDGIDSKDFPFLCQNHATSKLRDFEDLSKVSTLGFRGEALSSLCAISKLRIITTNNPPKATSLSFSKLGDLVNEATCSRKKGTTTFVADVFGDLPVRRKELNKNIKREYAKALNLISNYILISSNVRFVVNNVTKTGKRQAVLKSQGSQKMQDNLLNVYGSNALIGLMPMELIIDLNHQKSKLKVSKDGEVDYRFTISGLISKSSFGFGRPVNDRQFWFINKRPVTLTKFTKMMNEVYKSFNHLEYPCFLLNININQSFLDLNVTPDKRTILLHNETELLEELRAKVIEFYDSQDFVVPKNSIQRAIDSFATSTPQNPITNDADNVSENLTGRAEEKKVHTSFIDNGDNEVLIASSIEPQTVSPLKRALVDLSTSIIKRQRLQSPDHQQIDDLSDSHGSDSDSAEVLAYPVVRPNQMVQSILRTKRVTNVPLSSGLTKDTFPNQQQGGKPFKVTDHDDDETIVQEAVNDNSNLSLMDYPNGADIEAVYHSQTESPNCCHHSKDHESAKNESTFPGCKSQLTLETDDDLTLVHLEPKHLSISGVRNFEVTISYHSNYSKFIITERKAKKGTSLEGISINNIEDQDESEQLLTLTVSKRDFSDMKVIGQFNLGFILVIRNSKDLFIIDQHASDEKFNFEHLQKNTTFESQRLIQPLQIELNTMDELAVLENLSTFAKNGFKLNINEKMKPGSRISLESLPLSKNTVFDVSDFNELTHLVKQNPNNSSVRCSKIRSMFAMRACRKSIMIGQSLNMNIMTKVVRNLGTLEKPWNCPHGRPTMRHLMEVKQWVPFSEDFTL